MRLLKFIAICFLLTAFIGCFKVVPPVKSRKEANEKFLKICKDEYHLNVITNLLDHTLWVYLPITENILDYKVNKDKPKPAEEPEDSEQSIQKWAINYLNGYYKQEIFSIRYDIQKKKEYLSAGGSNNGVSSSYNEAYSEKQNHLLTALSRSYTDLENVPGDDFDFIDAEKDLSHKKLVKAYVKTEKPPEFIAIVVSDIKKGIEIATIFNFEDFKRVLMGTIPQEEFVKRNVSELVGNEKIVGDSEGTHIDFHDITWTEFLTKQALNRIRFKYQQSDFKPNDHTEEEIITIIAQTFQAYHFQDFKSVELNNLATEKKVIFEQLQIKTFAK